MPKRGKRGGGLKPKPKGGQDRRGAKAASDRDHTPPPPADRGGDAAGDKLKGSPSSDSSGRMPPPPPKRPAPSLPMAAEGAGTCAESMDTDDRDPAKRYKKLQKKLREIQKLELSERRDWLLNPEERAKLESREMLEVELIALRARADLVHPELADMHARRCGGGEQQHASRAADHERDAGGCVQPMHGGVPAQGPSGSAQ